MFEFELPYPPSVNHYFRMVGGRMLISREGRAFRTRVCSTLAAMGVRPLDGRLVVEIEIYPPDNRRRDVDNTLKSLLDALQHGHAYRDDSQIVDLHIRKCAAVDGGRTLVRIGPT
ncbi:MAG: RusA family crossover junction endodeoxyribonuclease [Planctomycetota bacterium]|nr:RusA family crossover junction endodeoxyribonuclease [Planctomycetota bacterium]